MLFYIEKLNYVSYGLVPQKWAKLLIENVMLVKITNRNTPLIPIASIQLSFQHNTGTIMGKMKQKVILKNQ